MSDNSYILEESKKIKVLIFNNFEFPKRPNDVRPPTIGIKFEKFFEDNYGKFVDITHFKNPKNDEVIKTLKDVSDKGSEFSALVVCVSSHGTIQAQADDSKFSEVIAASDIYYGKIDLWRPFFNERWKGKPKLFFIQACRGEHATAGAPLTLYGTDSKETELQEEHKIPEVPEFTELKFPDIFIMNASQQGTVSFRTESECCFVDALIEIFTKQGSKSDLLSMAVEISDRVARTFEAPKQVKRPELSYSQQMPCFETTLTKKFFFPKPEENQQKLKEKEQSFKNIFYKISKKPLAIVLNYALNSDMALQIARANENALKVGLVTAGFEYMDFWNVSKENLPKLLKTQYKNMNNSMILVIFNGYGEQDELYLNDKKIKVYELWESLLPDVEASEKSSVIPKMFVISAPPLDSSKEGVSGKIDQLCKPQTAENVAKCQKELDSNDVNIPITADLLILYETAAGKTSLEDFSFIGSDFLKIFSEELMNEKNMDFFDVFRNILYKLSTDEKFCEKEVPLAFSSLRKRIPVHWRNSSKPALQTAKRSGESATKKSSVPSRPIPGPSTKEQSRVSQEQVPGAPTTVRRRRSPWNNSTLK